MVAIEQKFYVEPMELYFMGVSVPGWMGSTGEIGQSIHPISVSLYAFFMENLWFQFATFPIMEEPQDEWQAAWDGKPKP